METIHLVNWGWYFRESNKSTYYGAIDENNIYNGSNCKAIACGRIYCYLTINGEVLTFGDNRYGALGDGTDAPIRSQPVKADRLYNNNNLRVGSVDISNNLKVGGNIFMTGLEGTLGNIENLKDRIDNLDNIIAEIKVNVNNNHKSITEPFKYGKVFTLQEISDSGATYTGFYFGVDGHI